MRILILDGDVNPAVACVRSLAKAGHAAIVGSPNRWAKAGWSRYCGGTFRYPDATLDSAVFARRIALEAATQSGTFVLPLTEPTTLAISAHRDLIRDAGGHILLPPHNVLLRACDKEQTMALADSLGIPVPWTVPLPLDAQTIEAASTFQYPVVLKPRMSEELSSDRRISHTARPLYARNAQEFIREYDKLRQRCAYIIVQEFIEGAGVLYCALLSHGELRAEYAYKRVRSVHPTGWGAAVRESIDPESMRDSSLALLRALDPAWHGVACVEFRRRPDGTVVYLELNPRIWNSLPAAVFAGIDFPTLMAELTQHGDIARQSECPLGSRSRWLLGDFRNLFYIWSGAGDGYPGRLPGRLETLIQFLTPVKGTFHDNFTPDDPLPELGDWIAAAARVTGIRKRRTSFHVAAQSDVTPAMERKKFPHACERP